MVNFIINVKEEKLRQIKNKITGKFSAITCMTRENQPRRHGVVHPQAPKHYALTNDLIAVCMPPVMLKEERNDTLSTEVMHCGKKTIDP